MFIRLARVYDSTTSTCSKAFVTFIRVSVPAPNVLEDDIFRTVIFC